MGLSSDIDGVHLELSEHRKLGQVLARIISGADRNLIDVSSLEHSHDLRLLAWGP